MGDVKKMKWKYEVYFKDFYDATKNCIEDYITFSEKKTKSFYISCRKEKSNIKNKSKYCGIIFLF